MHEVSAALHACAHLMDVEAGRLDAASFGVTTPLGESRALEAIREARTQLREAARDLAVQRREAGALLREAARAAASSDAPSMQPDGDAHAMLAFGAVAAKLEALGAPLALAITRDPRLPLLEAGLLVTSPLLGGWLLSRAAGDAAAPDPQVRRVSGGGPAGATDAATLLSTSRPATVSALVQGCALVDAMGGGEAAVVDIARITHGDGAEAWVITLPSTQDWVVQEGDAPAPNDLDAILALALLPGAASTYAKGIEQAVRQAGIPAGAPVLLVGFSLGGIVATDLARTGLGAASIEGVIAAGAPIDMADDPAGIPVLSLVHEDDVVPALDLAPEGDGPLRTTVTQGAPNGMSAHSASAYAATAAAHDKDGSLSAPYAQFLVTDARTAVVHRQYQIVER